MRMEVRPAAIRVLVKSYPRRIENSMAIGWVKKDGGTAVTRL